MQKILKKKIWKIIIQSHSQGGIGPVKNVTKYKYNIIKI